MPKHDVSQTNLLKKLISFNKLYLKNSQLITFLNAGCCAGFTALNLYAMWLSLYQHENNEEDKNDSSDNYQWLAKSFCSLASWNEKDNLSTLQISNFKHLLYLLQYYQSAGNSTMNCGNFGKIFFDSKNRRAICEFKLGASFTLKELEERLCKMVFNHRLVFIHFSNHVVGVIKYDEDLFYVDSNVPDGPRIFNSFAKLVKMMRFIIKDPDFQTLRPIPIAIETYRIESLPLVLPNYPTHEELLRDLRVFKSGYAFLKFANRWEDVFTPIGKALFVGSLESVSAIIEYSRNKIAIDEPIESTQLRANPLMMACLCHYELVDFLIAVGSNVNYEWRDKNNVFSSTPLIACLMTDKDAVIANPKKLDAMKTLIKAGANINVELEDYSNPLLISLKYQGVEHDMSQELIRNGANCTRTLYLVAARNIEKEWQCFKDKLIELGASPKHALEMAIDDNNPWAFHHLIKLIDPQFLMEKLGLSLLVYFVKENKLKFLFGCKEWGNLVDSQKQIALKYCISYDSFDYLMYIGVKPMQGWDVWAQKTEINLSHYIINLLEDYIVQNESKQNTAKKYLYKMFKVSDGVAQAKKLLYSLENSVNLIAHLPITHPDLLELFDIARVCHSNSCLIQSNINW